MKEQLITRKEFIALVERVKRKGLSYNEIARRINMPSPVLYNIRKGKPASFDALHVASLRDLIKEYENPKPPPPTFITGAEVDAKFDAIEARIAELEKLVRKAVADAIEKNPVRSTGQKSNLIENDSN